MQRFQIKQDSVILERDRKDFTQIDVLRNERKNDNDSIKKVFIVSDSVPCSENRTGEKAKERQIRKPIKDLIPSNLGGTEEEQYSMKYRLLEI